MFDELSVKLTAIMFSAWFLIAGTATLIGEILK
jgi:hypothetical protein